MQGYGTDKGKPQGGRVKGHQWDLLTSTQVSWLYPLPGGPGHTHNSGHGLHDGPRILSPTERPQIPASFTAYSPGRVHASCVHTLLDGATAVGFGLTPRPGLGTALVTGMRHGFRIGLQAQVQCRTTRWNTPSIRTQAPVVDHFTAQQQTSRCMIGSLCLQDCPSVIMSSIEAIPKKILGQWRVIVDLSSPARTSINDNLWQ